MNHKAVYRTAPATPGLLVTFKLAALLLCTVQQFDILFMTTFLFGKMFLHVTISTISIISTISKQMTRAAKSTLV